MLAGCACADVGAGGAPLSLGAGALALLPGDAVLALVAASALAVGDAGFAWSVFAASGVLAGSPPLSGGRVTLGRGFVASPIAVPEAATLVGGGVLTVALRTMAAATGCAGLAADCVWPVPGVAAALSAALPFSSSLSASAPSAGDFAGVPSGAALALRAFAAAAAALALSSPVVSGADAALLGLLAGFDVAFPGFGGFETGFAPLVVAEPAREVWLVLTPLFAVGSLLFVERLDPVFPGVAFCGAPVWRGACGGLGGGFAAGDVAVLASSKSANGGDVLSWLAMAACCCCCRCDAASAIPAAASDATLGVLGTTNSRKRAQGRCLLATRGPTASSLKDL